ncbi:type II toxin-antitoxin system YoeB family toxin [Lactobacillus helsingborgensis]|uniref:type II toxin-antitoxin system YoeB family toxin n=1 Tax=Lactobacillus helsingborgensis TaxID=1218494 RepID=UPI002741C3E6|nr:type II toxin-antitoxin system YoeB family toxin [Lactobacillus helsingborgensis]WLT01277.1 type II toxin-antitoxin system YoeB family toxin [Lactobacillus helsingborgensis]
MLISKPEKLKCQIGWSRRINNVDRLVYTVKNERLIIMLAKLTIIKAKILLVIFQFN